MDNRAVMESTASRASPCTERHEGRMRRDGEDMPRYTVKMRATFDDAVAAVMRVLEQRGFWVIRSFDLRSALDPNDPACSCPHHGTERCTCRYTVLLVYAMRDGAVADDLYPCTITIHARDAEAFISLARLEHDCAATGPAAAAVERALVQGLVEASLAVQNEN